MMWAIGGLFIIVSLLSTTPQGRAQARERLARWNPLFFAIIIAGLAIIFWPWPRA